MPPFFSAAPYNETFVFKRARQRLVSFPRSLFATFEHSCPTSTQGKQSGRPTKRKQRQSSKEKAKTSRPKPNRSCLYVSSVRIAIARDLDRFSRQPPIDHSRVSMSRRRTLPTCWIFLAFLGGVTARVGRRARYWVTRKIRATSLITDA